MLRLRAEREYVVRPLSLPNDPALSVRELASTPAVALFVDRARAVRYDFELTTGNAAAANHSFSGGSAYRTLKPATSVPSKK